MRSGDLGFLRDGHLYVTGRIKELIVIRGQNHAPQDIEACVASAHADILPGRVAAFALGGDNGVAEEGLGLVCELHRRACSRRDLAPVVEAIRRALGLTFDLAAQRILLVKPGSLPVTPSGKIQRLACRAAFSGTDHPGVLARYDRTPAASTTVASPRGGLAADLRAAPGPLRRALLLTFLRERLCEALGDTSGKPATLSEGRRFFDMGLDSATGVALVAALEQALDLALDPSVIYEFPTPATLADHLLARLFPDANADPSQPAPMPPAAAPKETPEDTPDTMMQALESLLAADPLPPRDRSSR